MMCIDTLHVLPVRRRTRGTEEIEEMRKQEDEETKRRRNKPLQLKLSGGKINAEWRLFLLRRPSTWISSNIFFLIRHGAEVFSSFPRFATILYVQYFFFDALNTFFLIPSQYFFLILLIFFLMRHPLSFLFWNLLFVRHVSDNLRGISCSVGFVPFCVRRCSETNIFATFSSFAARWMSVTACTQDLKLVLQFCTRRMSKTAAGPFCNRVAISSSFCFESAKTGREFSKMFVLQQLVKA